MRITLRSISEKLKPYPCLIHSAPTSSAPARAPAPSALSSRTRFNVDAAACHASRMVTELGCQCLCIYFYITTYHWEM
ncbi:hypothetical protein Hypma_001864 [Hypsizygus marmoreus]|uniref:Uncharacterized protein n=1 Tax=Hypsizygus marmoreus TaxID=39966 RepID=A0A369JBW8_HYPMA|nr:hypothetical protein Hypma_001864 [Hypsizygus marmoreus]